MTDIDANANTAVSAPGLAGAGGGGTVQATAAPGATGPGASISMTSAVGLTLGTAAVGLVGLGFIFRRGGAKLPPLRVDAANALNVYFSWLLMDATLKLVAYHYHGHKLAQAYLLIA